MFHLLLEQPDKYRTYKIPLVNADGLKHCDFFDFKNNDLLHELIATLSPWTIDGAMKTGLVGILQS